MKLTAVAAPGVLTGSVTGQAVFDAALAARGIEGDLVLTSSPAEFTAALRAAAADGEFLLVAGDDTPADHLLVGAGVPGARVVRVDLDAREPDTSRCVRRHVRWRGMQGLAFGVDDWFFHASDPGTRHTYGADRDQYADLRLPAGEGPFPVAVLVHGGYWRSRWDADVMHPLAVDLTARGFATWNVEYRRPDRHGWDATTADVAAALDALRELDAPLDLDRVVTLGHSAGGQLVTRLAADRATGSGIRPAFTVSLAGCLDLTSIHARGLSEHAVAAALGGTPEELPEVYAASSPIDRLPLGLPVAVVCGVGDDPDLLDASRRFATAAVAAGDDVTVVEAPGHHFSVIDPTSDVWARVARLVVSRVHG
ncbi:alpha/beta hydrolase [Kineococcus sp. R86509]|uniref:alpha/beta hydrolase n=1 Tax=Kineococcus sp. R86509 TaxID=3093851 RepID=UPI0036D41335